MNISQFALGLICLNGKQLITPAYFLAHCANVIICLTPEATLLNSMMTVQLISTIAKQTYYVAFTRFTNITGIYLSLFIRITWRAFVLQMFLEFTSRYSYYSKV